MLQLGRRGQSLVQVMVGMGVMTVAMTAFMAMQSYQQKMMLNNQSVMARNLLQLRIERYLGDPSSLTKTLATNVNTGLISCLKSPVSCTQTTAPQGFNLIDATNTKIAGSVAFTSSATATSAVLYDYNGAPCTTPSPQCLFQAYTTYSATCPSGTSPCPNPSVTAQYTVAQAPGITPVGGTPLKTVTSQPILIAASEDSSDPIPPDDDVIPGGTPCGYQNRGVTMYQKESRHCCLLGTSTSNSGKISAVHCSPN